MMGLDIGISAGASVAPSFGSLAGVGWYSARCHLQVVVVCRMVQYLGSLLVPV